MSDPRRMGQLRLAAEPAVDAWARPLQRSDARALTAADVLTAREVADLLRVPQSTVSDWARRGVIPSRRLGRRRLYLRPQLEKLLLEERP
jgi:excisionase family DNA binding protein